MNDTAFPGGRLAQLDRTLPTVAENLALDEALLIEADDSNGPPVLRTWESPEFAVILGATCKHREAARVDACERDGVPILRRSSGGGAVLIGPGAWNVALILPIRALGTQSAVDVAQKSVLERLAEALRNQGAPVTMRGSGDLAIGDRKIAGSAQRRLRTHLLIHATILVEFPLGRIADYLGPQRREPEYRAGRPHTEFVANLGLPRDRLAEAARLAWSDGQTPIVRDHWPADLVARLVAEKYGDPAWAARF